MAAMVRLWTVVTA
jgi:hypothetical protein